MSEPASMRGPLAPRIFFRENVFYVLELPDDDDLNAHAECNPGTLRIEDMFGNVLWPTRSSVTFTDDVDASSREPKEIEL